MLWAFSFSFFMLPRICVCGLVLCLCPCPCLLLAFVAYAPTIINRFTSLDGWGMDGSDGSKAVTQSGKLAFGFGFGYFGL